MCWQTSWNQSTKDNYVYKYLRYEDTVYRLHFYYYYKSVWAFFKKMKEISLQYILNTYIRIFCAVRSMF